MSQLVSNLDWSGVACNLVARGRVAKLVERFVLGCGISASAGARWWLNQPT